MRPTPNSRVERFRMTEGPLRSSAAYGNNGAFLIPCPGTRSNLQVIVSDGMGWEHVSVSLATRLPTYSEMQFVKELFWDDEETVIEYHPPKSRYVNNHPFCLHLWKPIDVEIPLPPVIMVGFK